ncbi:MAG: PucR family transcriptional regulator ligand-binding domain-containing protein [Carnobacterium sp.]|nr:PucR family transcriptional regulator ligand-binding domain-containing protein [Carnobacterium sp.]
MLTVNDFLQLAPFKEFEVVSGFKGLDNNITSVNIMDNPDALDWFSPGEMLVTSGYFFKNDKAMQDTVVNQLKAINCPALIIKPRRYLGDIPENMKLLSNELDIPIIEMPYGIAFSKVMMRVMEELSGEHEILNKQSLDIHNEFFQLSLHGGGIQKISSTLSHMMESSVFLCDQNWRLLSSSLLETTQVEKEEGFLSQPFFDSLPPEFENVQKPLVRTFIFDEKQICCIVMPVFFNSIHFGFIVVWKLKQTLTDHHFIALENGCMAFALERIQLREIERTRNRIRQDFFDELLAGKITSTTSLTNLADLHGINLSLWYTAYVLKVDFQNSFSLDLLEAAHQEEDKMKTILQTIVKKTKKSQKIFLVFNRKKQIILLVGTSPKSAIEDKLILKTEIEELIDSIEMSLPDCSLYCGIGRLTKQLMDINLSFYEAQEALRLTQTKAIKRKVYHFDDFTVHHFLKDNVSKKEMHKLFSYTLGSLYEHDQKFQSDLIETLECWIFNQLNIAETARQLYIHRNSLLYRIEKIQRILLLDLKDSDELLKIQLALKIYHMLYQKDYQH